MNVTVYSFLITFLAGLSTLIGSLFILKKFKTNNIINGALSFAAGVMTMVSIIDLIPEGITLLKTNYQTILVILIVTIFMVIGILISMMIDKYIPGINNSNNRLYRVGIISMIAIILHNIPEGIATFMAANTSTKLGLSLAIAIALHNIPEGISIAVPIYYSTSKKSKAFIYTLISGLSEPFGALLAFLFLKPFINNVIMGILMSLIAGIMIHISFYELLPTALKYNKKKISYLFFLIGITFMFINHILFL